MSPRRCIAGFEASIASRGALRYVLRGGSEMGAGDCWLQACSDSGRPSECQLLLCILQNIAHQLSTRVLGAHQNYRNCIRLIPSAAC